MTTPVLLCQGFQKAFIDPGSAFFSVSASLRRSLCEQILGHARVSGWIVIHVFLDTAGLSEAGRVSIEGFSPGQHEAFFRQSALSAFEVPGFAAKLDSLGSRPILFTSLAGLSVIAATFLDGMSRRLPMYLIGDAVADFAHGGVGEEQRIAALETLGRASGCWIAWPDLDRGWTGDVIGARLVATLAQPSRLDV